MSIGIFPKYVVNEFLFGGADAGKEIYFGCYCEGVLLPK